MKMILAVIDKDDASNVEQNLIRSGFSITKLSTTGGFLRAGNVTILIGVDDDKIQDAIDIIKTHSKSRSRQMPTVTGSETGYSSPMPLEVPVGGATVFVLNVERFEKI
jgi:uncharacterized protein YaaQ